MLVLGIHAVHAQSMAQTPSAETTQQSSDRERSAKPAPWSRSSIALTNTISTLSFDRGAEPFYNPTDTLSLAGRLNWQWNQHLCTALALGLSRELTTPDLRTQVDDVWLTDLTITMCLLRTQSPILGTAASLDWISYVPTSPISQAATLQYGGEVRISVRHTFDILWKPSLGYSGSVRLNAHEYTTRQQDAPSIAACKASNVLS